MIKEKLESYLSKEGFYPLQSNIEEIKAYVKVENNLLNILHVVEYSNSLYMSGEQMKDIKREIKDVFIQRGLSEVHVLYLILTENIERARALMQDDPFAWYIDVNQDVLVIDENKVPDFYGMKGMLQTYLSEYRLKDYSDREEAIASEEKVTLQERIRRCPYISLGIVLINIIVFALCCAGYTGIYDGGAVGLFYIEKGQWYRLFTSMFLHADTDHIVSNMLLFVCLGDMLEPHIGRWKYTLVYLLSGVLGNVVSCFYEYYAEVSYISVGASGAIYGLIGVVLYLVVKGDKSLGISISRIMLMVVYCIYSSFTEANINVAAHIGGLLAGYMCMLLMGIRKEKA